LASVEEAFALVSVEEAFSEVVLVVLAVLVSLALPSPPFFSLDIACLRDSDG
jgi:hypothetical protein